MRKPFLRFLIDMRIREFNHESVVVGANLSALLYSYYTGAPVVYIHPRTPFRFDYFEPEYDLDNIVQQPEPRELVSLEPAKQLVGLEKEILWERLFFVLSLSGQIPFADKVNSLRIGDKELKVLGKRAHEIDFKELRIFDDRGIQGIPCKITQEEKKYRVYDWISVHSCATHRFDYLDGLPSSVIEKIVFYPSDRIDGNHNKKDLVCISEMIESQLNDYQYSNTYIRFEVLKMMKDAGMKGRRNGRDQRNPERFLYYAIKIKNAERQIEPLGLECAPSRENIILDERTPEEIIDHFRGTEPRGYLGKIMRCLQNDTFI